MVAKRLKIQGFIVGDPGMGPAYTQDHQKNVQKWMSEGTFTAKVHETKGIDNGAQGFVDMLTGKNFGKALLVIKEME